MADEIAKMDGNYKKCMLGVTDDGNAELRRLLVDPTTKRLKVTAIISSGGGITSLGGLTGATQTFGNDTNVTMVSSGTAHTLTWAGQLANSRGGTGQDTSSSTGIAQVNSGTWSVSTALADGTTATTQSANDNSTKIATTAYVDAAKAEADTLAEVLANGATTGGTDITHYDAQNDGNPQIRIGASDAEEFHIQTVFDTGAQTLDYVLFQTDAASATADKGEYRFNVDGTLVATIDDGGIEIKASGSLSFGAVDILTDSSGTTTLNNIDALDATTEATIEAAIDTLANLTSASSLATVGTITSGTLSTGAVLADVTMTLGSDADGDTYYRSSNKLTRLAKGTANQFLAMNSGATAPEWRSMAAASDIDTGTDTTKPLSADALAGSNMGEKVVQMVVFNFTTDCATGDGKFYFHVPSTLAGMNLVEVHAECITAGTTGTMDIQIHNVTDAADMLSTVITIDSGETGSDTAATAPVIDTNNDDVTTNDLLRVDVDAVHTTAAKGLIVTLTFRLP